MLRLTSNRLPASLVYVVAVAGTAVATLIRHFVGDLGGRGPLGPFFLAVLLSGWLGGWWPGLLATIFVPLTLITGYFGMNFGWMVDRIDSPLAFWLLGFVIPIATGVVSWRFLVRPFLFGDVRQPRRR